VRAGPRGAGGAHSGLVAACQRLWADQVSRSEPKVGWPALWIARRTGGAARRLGRAKWKGGPGGGPARVAPARLESAARLDAAGTSRVSQAVPGRSEG